MEKFKSLFCRQEGQALLIVVLIMVVTLTSALSIASRTITNVKTSTEEERSQRAFAAAEAGIEKALSTQSDQFNISIGSSKYDANFIDIVGGTEFVLNNGFPVEANDGVDILLADGFDSQKLPNYATPKTYSNFIVYWGETGQNCTTNFPAAIEVIVLQGTKANPTASRYVYDPCRAERANNFYSVGVPGSGAPLGGAFQYRTPGGAEANRIILNSALLARIIPLYKSTKMTVNIKHPTTGVVGAGELLPSQGQKIESVGTSSETIRKIEVLQPYPKLPSEFFYVLFKAKQ